MTLLEAVRRRPFVPFRLHVTDGTTYEVRHPEMLMVLRGFAIVGLPPDREPAGLPERHEYVDLLHITRLEPLEAAKPAE